MELYFDWPNFTKMRQSSTMMVSFIARSSIRSDKQIKKTHFDSLHNHMIY